MKKTLVLLMLLSAIVRAQLPLIPAPIEARIDHASLVIEGTVISKEYFQSSLNKRILTRNLIRVSKIFKGTSDSLVEIITQGGQIGSRKMVCHELAKLQKDEKSIFFCIPSRNDPGQNNYDIFSEKQGVLTYNSETEIADLMFGTYTPEYLTKKIEQRTGQKARILSHTTTKSVNKVNGLAEISTLSPQVLTAGTNSVLTITGSGFGSVRGNGNVKFRDADDGGASFVRPNESEYISWSDTKIEVKVPTEAGTGPIKVTSNGNGIVMSPATLEIRFARTQVEYEEHMYSPILVNEMAGGYPWKMYSSFKKDTLAAASFLRAFNKWRCSTGVNWYIGEETEINVTDNDNLNIIRFDEGDELPEYTLAVCYSYYMACTPSEWYVSEYDIIFDKESPWGYGPELPNSSQYDFETVAFHELGHGHQLAHVINTSNLMHFAISRGEHQRNPTIDDIEAGKLVLEQSQTTVCGFSPMRAIPSDECNDAYFAFSEDLAPIVYPIPVTNTLSISYYVDEDNNDVDIVLLDMDGKKIVQFVDEKQTKGEHTITSDVSSYGLDKGIYILRSRFNNQDYSRKIISVK